MTDRLMLEMGDSDNFKMLGQQPNGLELKSDDHPGLETLPPNHSQSELDNDSPVPKKNASDDEIDIIMSDNEQNLPQDNSNVGNVGAENDLQEPKNNAENAIIEIVPTTDANVSQILINPDNDDGKQGTI